MSNAKRTHRKVKHGADTPKANDSKHGQEHQRRNQRTHNVKASMYIEPTWQRPLLACFFRRVFFVFGLALALASHTRSWYHIRLVSLAPHSSESGVELASPVVQ